MKPLIAVSPSLSDLQRQRTRRNKEADRFVYRDNVWRGADLSGRALLLLATFKEPITRISIKFLIIKKR